MSRTNIEIDDALVADVMARYNLRTKREAVDFALRQVQRRPLSGDEILALKGVGWDGDLESIKRSRVADWVDAPDA